MPIGVATLMPRKVRTRLPTIALAMPPPSVPGPGVSSVKTAGESAPTPWMININRIEPRTTPPSAVDSTQRSFSAWSARWRPRRTRPHSISRGAFVVAAVASMMVLSNLLDLDARNEQASDHQNHERDEEENAAE